VTFGDTSIDDQQLGVVWLKNVIISCSLSGFINYVDPETMSLKKVLKGHNKSIMSLAIDDKKEYAFTGDFEGNISNIKFF
jgi:WD40 repeat protein